MYVEDGVVQRDRVDRRAIMIMYEQIDTSSRIRGPISLPHANKRVPFALRDVLWWGSFPQSFVNVDQTCRFRVHLLFLRVMKVTVVQQLAYLPRKSHNDSCIPRLA